MIWRLKSQEKIIALSIFSNMEDIQIPWAIEKLQDINLKDLEITLRTFTALADKF